MARHVTKTCDVCEKEAEIVTKLFLVPLVTEPQARGNGSDRGRRKSEASNYTAHMDVCKMCAPKIIALGNWQKRQKMPRRKKVTK